MALWVPPDVAEGRYAHGTPARYVFAKCRCFACKVANCERQNGYVRARRGLWRVNGTGRAKRDGTRTYRVQHVDTHEVVMRTAHREIAERRARALNRRSDDVERGHLMVSPAKAIRHIEKLRAQGVGIKTTALRAGLSATTISGIVGRSRGKERRHRVKRTRLENVEAILSVTVEDARGRAKIDGAATWKLLDDLIARGFTKSWIASQIAGHAVASLQIRRDGVSGETARKVRDLHGHLAGQYPPARTGRWKYTPPPAMPVAREVAIDDVPPATPLSKRDPAIAARWAQLNFGGG